MAVGFKGAGTFQSGTGALTVPFPTVAANDVALLVVTSENEAISLTTANGFALLGSATSKAAGTAATDPASRLVVYWKRCTGSDASPVVADSNNNTEARIFTYSGCTTTGNPWASYAEGNDSAANDTSGSIPSASVSGVSNTLVVLICSTSYNATSTAEFSAWTNSNLTSITERGDNTNTAGLGGGFGVADGTYSGTGDYGTTTVTLAHTSYKGTMSIALKPSVPTTIVTYDCTDITSTSALANGEVFLGDAPNSNGRGFVYMVGTTGDPVYGPNLDVYTGGIFYGGTYNISITGLSSNTSYRVRSFTEDFEYTMIYGNTVTVTTSSAGPKYVPRMIII